MRTIRLMKLFAAFAAAMLMVAAPALAHKHPAEAPAEATPVAAAETANSAAADAAAADMPVTDMAWPTAGDGGMMMSHPMKRPATFAGRLIAWLGMWHPAIVHFPIGLLLTVAFLELAGAVRGSPLYTASNKILLAVAALGAFAAAPLGWADAASFDASATLTLHRWIGTAMPFLLLLLWYLKRPAEQAAIRWSSRSYETLLGVSALLILVQAYLGGEITHGANHMAF